MYFNDADGSLSPFQISNWTIMGWVCVFWLVYQSHPPDCNFQSSLLSLLPELLSMIFCFFFLVFFYGIDAHNIDVYLFGHSIVPISSEWKWYWPLHHLIHFKSNSFLIWSMIIGNMLRVCVLYVVRSHAIQLLWKLYVMRNIYNKITENRIRD